MAITLSLAIPGWVRHRGVWAMGVLVAAAFALGRTPACVISKDNLGPIRTIARSNRSHGARTIHFVIPIYQNRESWADLTRMLQSLSWVPDLHWVGVTVGRADRPRSATIRSLAERNRVDFSHWHLTFEDATDPALVCRDQLDGLVKIHALPPAIQAQLRVGTIYLGHADSTWDGLFFEAIRQTPGITRVAVDWTSGFSGWIDSDRELRGRLASLAWSAERAHLIAQVGGDWAPTDWTVDRERAGPQGAPVVWLTETERHSGASLDAPPTGTNLAALAVAMRNGFMSWAWSPARCSPRPWAACRFADCPGTEDLEQTWSLEC